jgi:DNA-binding beta-propeller fold protein YncE
LVSLKERHELHVMRRIFRTLTGPPGSRTPVRRVSLPRLILTLALGLLLIPSSAEARKKKKSDETGPQKELVWPLPPEQPRIRYLRSFHGDEDFKKKKKSRWKRILLGPQEEKHIYLKKPYGVATDSAGRVYVTDSALGGIMVFDEEAKDVRALGHAGQIKFRTPIGIAVDGEDRIFVSDVGLHMIIVMDGSGGLLMGFGKKEGLKRPSGLAIDRERGRLYVSDTPEHRIVVYGLDGKLLESLGSRGDGKGEFNYPTNVAVAPDGTLFVVDTGNFRIQSFSPDGEFLMSMGEAGTGYGNFSRPKGISLDSQGHLYVVDAAFNNFQIFNRKGEILMFVGGGGYLPGNFHLPAGIHIDGSDRVYVADQANSRVQVFQYLPSSNPDPEPDPARPEAPAMKSAEEPSSESPKGGDAPTANPS